MSGSKQVVGGCTLEVAKLFERVNTGRKVRSLPPVENSAMVSRCNLRFNLDKKRGVDFNQETIVITNEDVEALEQLLNEQFDCKLEGTVKKLCQTEAKAPAEKTQVEKTPATVFPGFDEHAESDAGSETGLMSKIKKIFGGE